MSTFSDVQKALTESQLLQQHRIDGGWDALSAFARLFNLGIF